MGRWRAARRTGDTSKGEHPREVSVRGEHDEAVVGRELSEDRAPRGPQVPDARDAIQAGWVEGDLEGHRRGTALAGTEDVS